MSTMVNDPRLVSDDSAGTFFQRLRRRMSYADIGQLPELIGLVLIWVIVQAASGKFLSPVHLTNLILQSIASVITSVGVTICHLLGG